MVNYVREKARGLDFSMVYVGDLQRTVEEFHGYSMTDTGDMRRMLKAVPVDPGKSAFIDIGCGKSMCMKCAVESGYKKVAGLDPDGHLLEKIKASQEERNRDIWAAYYHPVFADAFDSAGLLLKDELRDKTRDTTTRFYCYPKR